MSDKKEFTPKIFVSDYRGYSPQDNEKEPVICVFSPFKVTHPVKGEIDAGHYLCKDEVTYNRLKQHPDYGKGFKEVRKLPSRTQSSGSVISGVVTGGQDEAKPLSDEERLLLRELGHLEAKFLDEDGKIKRNVKKEAGDKAMNRIKDIRKQFNIVG